MKKLFAILLAASLLFGAGAAFAELGWSPSVNSSPALNASVSISVKALEYSGTSTDYDQSGLNNARVWKEITGPVVKDTLLKFPVVVDIPGMESSGLSEYDYANETLTLNLENASILDVVAADEGSGSGYASIKASFEINAGASSARLALEDGYAGQVAFTVVAIVSSTNKTRCSVNFSMGQGVQGDGSPIRFGGYTASWTQGQSLIVEDGAGNSVHFSLDANNLFTSAIYFTDVNLAESMSPVGYCMNGELEFAGLCACTGGMEAARYKQAAADFNAILNALGFSLRPGAFSAAYCTEAGLKSLTRQVQASGSVTVGSSPGSNTNINIPGYVTIPQTGSLSLMGFALITLSGAALAMGGRGNRRK